jgi:hypothetical protein
VYGAFNFWKTRDVEVVQQAADYKARRKPIVAPPKVVFLPCPSLPFLTDFLQPKATDEALLKKPPLQAVRLRFLQKSKSVESIQTKPVIERNERLSVASREEGYEKRK